MGQHGRRDDLGQLEAPAAAVTAEQLQALALRALAAGFLRGEGQYLDDLSQPSDLSAYIREAGLMPHAAIGFGLDPINIIPPALLRYLACVAVEEAQKGMREATHRHREEVDRLKDEHTLRIKLAEGRNRQIRRMMDAVHHPVYALTRTAIGPITLKGLAPGEWRELTAGEVNQLKRQRKQSGGGASSPRGGGEGRRRNFTPGRPRRQAMYDDGDDDHDDDHERRRSRKNSGRFGGWQQQQ